MTPDLGPELEGVERLAETADIVHSAAVDRRSSDRPRFMLVDRLAQRGENEVLGGHTVRLPFFPAHPEERTLVPFAAALVGRSLESHTRAHRPRLPQRAQPGIARAQLPKRAVAEDAVAAPAIERHNREVGSQIPRKPDIPRRLRGGRVCDKQDALLPART